MKNKILSFLLVFLSITLFGQQWTQKSNAASSTEFSPLLVIAIANPETINLGESTTLTANASGGTGTYTYTWVPNENLSAPHSSVTTATPTDIGVMLYTVHVDDGVNTASADVEVTVADPSAVFCPSPINFSGAYFWEDQEFGVQLSWDKADYDFTLDRFEIYRSPDGINYKLIQRIVNTPSISHYECSDVLEETGSYYYRIVAFYQNDCESDPADILVTVSDVNDHHKDDIMLYPNPTIGKVNIAAERLKRVDIINGIGQTIGRTNADSDHITLDLSSFGKGLYLLIIQTENGMIRQSVIVK